MDYTFDPFDTTDDSTANDSPMMAPETDPGGVATGDLDDVGTGGYSDTVVDRGSTPGEPIGRLDDPMGTPGVGGIDQMSLGSDGFRMDAMGPGGTALGTGEMDNDDGFDPTTYEL
jgi:hypothetical protein